tara:strand:+ start:734 stop:1747 length:1014 start_codon:yes stop_codon:yes gene_type:complete
MQTDIDNTKNIKGLNKSVLVTGCGYIGSNIAKDLYRNGYTPVVIGKSIQDTSISNFAECFEVDLPKDIHLLDEIVKRYDIESCIHTASSKSISDSIVNPNKYYKNNVVVTIQLLNKLVELGMKKIVFTSSSAVYGNTQGPCLDTDTNLKPLNPYGHSKLMCERIIQDYCNAFDLSAVSLRIFNVAGTDIDCELGDTSKNARHLIPSIIQAGFQANEFILNGTDYTTPDGTCMRDYIHIQDVTSACIMALKLEQKYECLNIGTNIGITNQEVLDQIQKHTGAINVRTGPRRQGDPDMLIADITRTKDVLNWKPTHSSIDNVIRSAVQWYKTCNKKEMN